MPDLPLVHTPLAAGGGWSARNLQAILLNAPSRATRLAALRETLKLPDVRAAALLRRALRDSDEEVRLLAHALLSRKEKAVESQIHTLQLALEQHAAQPNFALHKALAYSYWQMALLGHPGRAAATPVMSYASEHARLALDLQPSDAGLALLQCRIQLGLDAPDAASSAYQKVTNAGLPEIHTRPYLAEMAFQQRRASRRQASDAAGDRNGLAAPQSDVVRSWKGEGHAIASV